MNLTKRRRKVQNVFKNIQVGAAFYLNGNYCIKRSSRTADVYERDGGKHYGRFYVKMNEICKSRP